MLIKFLKPLTMDGTSNGIGEIADITDSIAKVLVSTEAAVIPSKLEVRIANKKEKAVNV